MKLTLGLIVDACLARVANPHQTLPSAILAEANAAQDELYFLIRESREDWLLRTTHRDIYDGIEVYDLPIDCQTLKRLERITSTGVPQELQRLQAPEENRQQLLAAPETYTFISDKRIRIQPVPTESTQNGLRYNYYRSVLPLSEPDDVPDFPEEFHEWLIAGTMSRLRQYADVAIAQPEALDGYIAGQTERIQRHLRPQHLSRPRKIPDEDPDYVVI